MRPHAIRQTLMDRANMQINRLEAAEGALHRGQGFVVEHTVGADQVADGLRHRSGYRENRAARKPPLQTRNCSTPPAPKAAGNACQNHILIDRHSKPITRSDVGRLIGDRSHIIGLCSLSE